MMTPYPIDSPQAAVRLLALAVTVDGVPARDEMAVLEANGVLKRLGFSHDGFEDAMDALCADLRAHSRSDGCGFRCLRPEQVRGMLNEIKSPTLQSELAGLFFEIFCADNLLTRAESLLLWDALDHWCLHLRDVAGARSCVPDTPLLRTAVLIA